MPSPDDTWGISQKVGQLAFLPGERVAFTPEHLAATGNEHLAGDRGRVSDVLIRDGGRVAVTVAWDSGTVRNIAPSALRLVGGSHNSPY